MYCHFNKLLLNLNMSIWFSLLNKHILISNIYQYCVFFFISLLSALAKMAKESKLLIVQFVLCSFDSLWNFNYSYWTNTLFPQLWPKDRFLSHGQHLYIHIYVITKTLCDCKWLKVTISADYANIFCNIETLSLFDKSWYKVDNIYKILRVLVFKCSSQARFTYKLLQHCFIKLGKGFGLCHGSHVIQSKPETKIFQFLKNRENESCQSYSNNSKSLW